MNNTNEEFVENPQFNVALIGNQVSIACNKRFIIEIKNCLSIVPDIQKDFEDFIDHIDMIISDNSKYCESEEYGIMAWQNKYHIFCNQEIAKDLSFCIPDSIRAYDGKYSFASSLFAFSRKLDLAAEGDFHKLQNNGRPFQQQMPMMMYQAVPVHNMDRRFNNFQTRRHYGK
jgi:hypothetical protein